jgi:hypothetical protein
MMLRWKRQSRAAGHRHPLSRSDRVFFRRGLSEASEATITREECKPTERRPMTQKDEPTHPVRAILRWSGMPKVPQMTGELKILLTHRAGNSLFFAIGAYCEHGGGGTASEPACC